MAVKTRSRSATSSQPSQNGHLATAPNRSRKRKSHDANDLDQPKPDPSSSKSSDEADSQGSAAKRPRSEPEDRVPSTNSGGSRNKGTGAKSKGAGAARGKGKVAVSSTTQVKPRHPRQNIAQEEDTRVSLEQNSFDHPEETSSLSIAVPSASRHPHGRGNGAAAPEKNIGQQDSSVSRLEEEESREPQNVSMDFEFKSPGGSPILTGQSLEHLTSGKFGPDISNERDPSSPIDPALFARQRERSPTLEYFDDDPPPRAAPPAASTSTVPLPGPGSAAIASFGVEPTSPSSSRRNRRLNLVEEIKESSGPKVNKGTKGKGKEKEKAPISSAHYASEPMPPLSQLRSVVSSPSSDDPFGLLASIRDMKAKNRTVSGPETSAAAVQARIQKTGSSNGYTSSSDGRRAFETPKKKRVVDLRRQDGSDGEVSGSDRDQVKQHPKPDYKGKGKARADPVPPPSEPDVDLTQEEPLPRNKRDPKENEDLSLDQPGPSSRPKRTPAVANTKATKETTSRTKGQKKEKAKKNDDENRPEVPKQPYHTDELLQMLPKPRRRIKRVRDVLVVDDDEESEDFAAVSEDSGDELNMAYKPKRGQGRGRGRGRAQTRTKSPSPSKRRPKKQSPTKRATGRTKAKPQPEPPAQKGRKRAPRKKKGKATEDENENEHEEDQGRENLFEDVDDFELEEELVV